MNDKINKIKKFIDEGKLENLTKESRIFIVELPGKPESYARERKGRGKHFYNPKSGKMSENRKIIKRDLDREEKEYLSRLVDTNNEKYDSEYYYTVSLHIKYYLPIPKTDSIKLSAQKEMNMIRPMTRPDLDNYDKFILDTLHDVFYDDDKRVIKIESEKFFSLEPRTVIIATVEEINQPG